MKSSEMKKATKRILAMLLCTSMVLSSGVSASADEGMAAAQEQGHVHTEACYEKQNTGNLICTKAEVMEGHVHGDECYDTTPKLTCEQEEHSHNDGCYTTETKDVCNDESEEHTCGDACVETEEVLTCTAEEHSHNDGCYETETNLICGQEEVEAHIHNDECYAWEEKLVCTLSETAPMAEEAAAQETVTEQPKEDKKAEEAAEAEEVNLQNDDETGIKVSVKSTSDVIPEDTKVVVAPMEMDEEHETALAEAVSEFEVLGYTAYDISLKDAEDEDITLGENKVEVAIDFEELIPEGINAEEVKDVVLVHITTDEEDKLTAEAVGTVEITEEKATVEFEADSFSPYVVTYLGETEEAVEEVAVEEPVVEDVVLTYISEDEAYTVTVTGTPEVLENVAAFEAVPVTDEEKIEALTEQLTAKAAEMQKTSLGFENYEFKFLDAEGNEVSVNGEVKVSLSFAEERIPEAATAENVDAVDAALLKTGTDDKGEAVLEEMNGLVSAEAGAVKEVVYTTAAPEELILAWSGDVYRTLPNYEDDDVVITLAGTEYALQNVVGFNVTPIKEDNEETEEQYAEVAKQLEEKIAEENEEKEEEKSVVGFLAYDITLVDAEGNELEPQGGVRVSMEYKEAAAPEAVAEVEEAEVTIHHFEEDEKGEVKQIVDMVEEETIEAEVTTTKNAEVEKAEFVTDSFSIFTITWSSTVSSEDGTAENRAVSGTVVTLTGSTFTVTNRTIDLTEEIDSEVIRISDIEFTPITQDNTTYVFNKVVACKGNYTSAGAIEVTSINYYKGNYRANNNENYVITNDASGYSLYFVYLKADAIPTIDSKSENININIFDYSQPTSVNPNNGEKNHTVIYDINKGHELKFLEHGSTGGAATHNTWTGTDGGARQKLVKYNLVNNYPFLNLKAPAKNESLSYLFQKDKGYEANYLLKEEDGYYVYRSSENFAEFDTATRNFTVYKKYEDPTQFTGFFPFNKYGQTLEDKHASTSTTENHHFGMHIDFTFMQPHEGKVNGQNMVFEFSGDDDVWIFIDGMLVLDLGGIHLATGGTIDFATGIVDYTHADFKSTTIRAMYEEALKELEYTPSERNDKLAEYFVGETSVFKDYSQHKLDFFYLERGAHESNCEIKFNLISIPKDSVTIEKQISNYADGAYSDVEFSFEMYLQNGAKDKNPGESKDGDAADTLITVTEEGKAVQYEHIAVDGTRTIKTLGTDGVFKLKHKEKAVFSHLDVATKFYVVETDISHETYDKVEIEGAGVLNENDESIIGENQESISSKTLEIGTNYYAKFLNRCAASNLKHLSIEKAFDENSLLEDNPDFTFRVTVAGELYTGKYKVGSSYEEAVASQQEHTAAAGEIKLKVGQVAVILGYATADNGKIGIPSETSFMVEEINLDLNSYVPPKYEVTEADDIEEVNTKNGWASGKISIDKGNPHVEVTNALRKAADSPEIKVSKTFSGLTRAQLDSFAQEFSIILESKDITPAVSSTLKLTNGNVVQTTEENGDITFTWTLPNYPAGTYVVKESGEVLTGFDNVIKINGTEVTANTLVEITTTAATLNYTSTMRETKCNATTYNVGNINLIVAKLTSDAGYFVWTKQRISVNERLGITDLINSNSGIHFSPTATLSNCYFYSGDISDTLVFRDGEIRYDGSQNLTFDDSSQWAMFATGTYEVVNGDSAEIVFENTYTPSTIDVDLKKTTINDSPLSGAEFEFYKYSVEGEWELVKTVSVDNTEKAMELTDLAAGRYKLVEVKAPTGFVLLGEDIYFTVENTVASLTDAAGNALAVAPRMWALDATNNVLTVKNDVLYELPSTGGHGIYTTMLGGFALMLGAAYVWFTSRRKESSNN